MRNRVGRFGSAPMSNLACSSICAVEATDLLLLRVRPPRRLLSLTQSLLPAKPNRTSPAGCECVEGTVRRWALFIERRLESALEPIVAARASARSMEKIRAMNEVLVPQGRLALKAAL